MNILLIDDDDMFAAMVKTMLKGSDYYITWAEDIKSTKKFLQNQRFDIALIDIVLREESGLDILPLIKEKYPDTIPVMISGHASLETALEALQKGAYDYLLKPLSKPELDNLLNRCREKIHILDENKKAQELLAQVQKLEAVGRITATIAHDFNNVLMAIIGNAELLMESLREKNSSEDIADLTEILNAAKKGKKLTDSLLAFSSRSMKINGDTSIDQVINNAYQVFARLVKPEAKLITDLNTPDKKVAISHMHLEQIILNLLNNAKEAITESGKGQIVIKTEDVGSKIPAHLFSVLPPDTRYIKIEVRDNGIGMDEETLKHAMEPFFTTKEGHSGTGLSVVHHLVHGTRGLVDIQSSKNNGTRVCIYIPQKED
ncbi:response regulator [Spirochaetia bacterium 38H-sp]|uniref:histidine kinase n=1 Tax=Rarispira pelagica TaxID=3141764 RepID=A0ABU9UCA3_9SPIR